MAMHGLCSFCVNRVAVSFLYYSYHLLPRSIAGSDSMREGMGHGGVRL